VIPAEIHPELCFTETQVAGPEDYTRGADDYSQSSLPRRRLRVACSSLITHLHAHRGGCSGHGEYIQSIPVVQSHSSSALPCLAMPCHDILSRRSASSIASFPHRIGLESQLIGEGCCLGLTSPVASLAVHHALRMQRCRDARCAS
jgi:hypothetical protein